MDLKSVKTVRKKKIGGVPISISSLHRVFTNPFYYGKVKSGDNIGWGEHEPMVTQREFEKVQEILQREGRKGESSYEFPLTGYIKCGCCDSGITAEEKVKYWCPKCKKPQTAKNPKQCSCRYKIKKSDIAKGHWYKYYRCTKKKLNKDQKCNEKCVRAEKLEAQFETILSKIEINPKFEQWSLKWLKYMNEEEFSKKKNENQIFLNRYNKADDSFKRLIKMRAEGEITKEEFLIAKKEAEVEKEKAKRFLDGSDQSNQDWVKEAEDTLDFVLGITKRFKEGTIKEKKHIFSKTGSNFKLENQKLSLDIGKQYLLFKELEELADIRIEPEVMRSQKGLSTNLKRRVSVWQAR